MLDKYKEYETFYKIIKNSINSNKISHAYLFEIDDSINVDEFRKDIVKIIITNDGKKYNELLVIIENDNYQNVRYIFPDGQYIKKEQIEVLQEDFSKESFDNNKKIYVIVGAENLNKTSANKLLKFLEEPSSDIVAILITKNKYAVIDTIKSRCINISLKKQEKMKLDIESIEYKVVDIIEQHKNKSLYYLYELLNNEDMSREKIKNIFIRVSQIYLDLLNINNNTDSVFFNNEDLINIKYDKNNILLINKVDTINKYIDYFGVNINIKTFIDEIIYGVYGGE